MDAAVTDEQIADASLEVPAISSLDLTQHSVLAHFAKTTKNVQLLNFLLALDRVDRWAVDFNESESPQVFDIQLYMQELQRFVEASLPVLHRVPKEFAEVLSHLTTTRCMYLLRYVSQHNEAFLESFGGLLEAQASNSADIAAVKRRLEAFSKARLLGEIFSGKRLNRIVQIMGSYSDV